jgi:PAS domain S-box-containing protein
VSEVSAQLLRFFRDLAPQHGIAYADLAAGIPGLDAVPPGLFARMSWDTYVALWERFEQLGAPPAAVDDSGRLAIHHALSRPLQAIASGLTSSRAIYQALVEWFGPSLFGMVDFSIETSTARSLRVVMEIQTPYRPCPWFFRSARGALCAVPTLLGQPEALVVAELGDRRGVFDITPPPAVRGWGRVRRVWKVMGSLSAAIGELSAQQRQLNEGHAALLRSQSELQRVIESVPDGVVIHRQGTIVFANPAFGRCLGLSASERAVGCKLDELADPADRAAVVAWLSEASPGTARACRFRRRDGGLVVLELSASQPVELAGAPGRLLVARDVTEQRQLELKLARADRLVAMGTLAAGVAHEINNPLAYLMLSLEAILREVNGAAALDRKAIAELAQTAREGGERVRAIVGNLKTLSRGDDEALAAVDLHAVLEWSIGVAHHQIRHHARIVRELGPVPKVRANEGRLGQVFLNLLINAAHSMPDGQAAQNEIRVITRTGPAGDALVEIRDTGGGIAPENLGRIFDPFFTTKAVGVGTGIGLSICHSIVTGMGGDIEVESRLGHGSTFRVRLPPDDGRVDAAVSPVPEAAGDQRRARILIVDDEVQLAQLLGELLAGHEVSVVSRGRDALERLERAPFDVIFCDMMMPDLGGVEIYQTVRQRWPGLERRIVFMTGGAFSSQARAFLDSVDNPCLDKPFNLRAIDEAIEVALGRE